MTTSVMTPTPSIGATSVISGGLKPGLHELLAIFGHGVTCRGVSQNPMRLGDFRQEKGLGDYPSPELLVEAAGIEPASASPLQEVLHA